ncbi:MAG: class I SAM-dependent methyltransferase [Deltaproteobacteria bacterium]|nr:class I SAM-dependent methyltransferase [Deltaproteobacteria bacterium]
MSFYEQHILPKASHFICSSGAIMDQRKKVVPRARGRVLEIGIGSGLNFPFYDESKVELVWGLEPSAAGLARAEKQARETSLTIELLRATGEEIPLDSNSADTVLVTYTLCTIPDAQRALAEIRRVLRPGGELIFCEHGLAPDEKVRRWQYRLNPFWARIGGGCNLTRPIPRLIEQGGFRINDIEAGYIPGWKLAAYHYWGSAAHGHG